MERTLQENADRLIKDINTLIGEVIVKKQTNEQWFLDFLKSIGNINKGELDNFRRWNIKKLPRKSGIYCFENKINGKLYIGQSQNIRERVGHHINSKDNLYIHKAIRKYGVNNFNIYILEFCDIDKLSELEIKYIQKYNSFINGYNLTGGGEGNRGRKLSEYHKKNIGNKNSKEIWAYDYKNNHYIKGNSCKDISNKLLNMGHNISIQKIYDAISRKTQCENFTFGHTPQDAEKISNTIKLPKNIEFYLYNYKTKEYSNKFTSFTDGENYIRQSGCELSNGHLYTAILNDNKYIKDFLFAYSMEELKQKVENFVPELYLYNILENKIYKFPNNISYICNELTKLGYKVNLTSLSKARCGKQKSSCGFIIGLSMDDLLNKIMSFNINMCDNIYKLSQENDYLNSQELLNWQDKINEISVR